jgi:hypothetical protein
MGRLKDAMGKLTATHILLFLIAVGLTMNWVELRGINKNLVRATKSLVGIDVDLTTPIDVNIPSAIDVNTDH